MRGERLLTCILMLTAFELSAGTMALYDFSEGAVGEDVVTTPNAGALGHAYDGTASVAAGGSVKYSDDLPGKYLYADRSRTGAQLSANWKSVEFKVSGGNGGMIEIPALGGDLATLGKEEDGAFTVELFFKLAETQDWKPMSRFYYEAETSTTEERRLHTPASMTTRSTGKVLWSVSTTTPSGTAVEVGKWYHFAGVHSGGVWRAYLDGICFQTTENRIKNADSTKLWLHLGAGDGTANAAFSGKIAGVRVSDVALEPVQFLKASSRSADPNGALGLWLFAEGTPGEAVTRSTNAVDCSDVIVGAAVPRTTSPAYPGAAPVYSDDVPGARLYAGQALTNLVSTDYRSVRFFGTTNRYEGGGVLTVSDFRTRLATGSFTLEYFIKYGDGVLPDSGLQWRNTFAINNMTAAYHSISMCNNAQERFGFTVRTRQAGVAEEHFSGVIKPPLFGNWHHTALEWDAETGVMSVYFDYSLASTATDIAFDAIPGDAWLGCVSATDPDKAFCGKIAAIRVMPRCLEPSEMLVAVNAGDGKTVLHWSFEDEPTAVGDALEDVYARPLNIASRQGIAAHLVSTKPTVSSEVYRPTRQSVCQGGETLAPNLRSAYFYGYSETYAQSWAGSFIYSKPRGTQPDFRTADFTFELFLRCDLTARQGSVDGQTLGGYGAAGTDKKDPDWYVALAADSPHNVTLVYTDNEGTKHSRDMGFCLGDGKWHHFAVTYAAATREAVAYLDYAEKARLTLETDMRLSTNETFRYDFGRNLGSSGFTGWMDDIRISRCVRPVSEFLRKGPPHGLIMIFR